MGTSKHFSNLQRSIAQFMYTITAIDGKIRKEENQKLLELLNTTWKDSSSFNSSEIEEISNTYLKLKEESQPAQICFDKFIAFKNSNELLFTNEIKKLLWETACIVTSEVNNKNKSELILLVKLEKELRNKKS